MKLRIAPSITLTLALAAPLIAQVPDFQTSIMAVPRRSSVATEGTTTSWIAKFNSSGGVTESSILNDGSGVIVFTHLHMNGGRLLLMYPALQGYGNDLAGMMGGLLTISAGFNSEGTFAGTPGQLSGRQMYFADNPTARLRAAVDSDGTWWFGTSPTNYSLKVAAPATSSIGPAIDSAGNMSVGGAADTAYKLKVYGDSYFAGNVRGQNIQAHYQDVAEWVPAAEDLAPGTVVVLDQRTNNTVKASVRPYDTMVAGVVSVQPGLILGEAASTKEQIATTGRVRVKVDASRGAIAIGDILVTGTVAGTAMKSTPVEVAGIAMHRPGTIIGKALEPLADGNGEILVLLSLQ